MIFTIRVTFFSYQKFLTLILMTFTVKEIAINILIQSIFAIPLTIATNLLRKLNVMAFLSSCLKSYHNINPSLLI